MRSLPSRFDPAQVEAESAAFWKGRQLPSPEGGVGPPSGASVHQFVSPLTRVDSGLDFLQRAVRADAEARFLAQAGRHSLASLASRRPDYPNAQWVTEQLRNCGVWSGGGQLTTIDALADIERIQAGLDRLVELGIVRAREAPVRACPSCLMPRNPSGIVYAAETGEAYLVRFPLAGASPRTSLLVWTDAAWKLLGTCAVLVNPDLTYVHARYRRRGVEETVVVLRSAVERLKGWLDGCEIEVLEEHPGTHWVGARYDHPLQTEFPILNGLPEPAGTVVASADVDDSGTGLVALVPGHGASDDEVGRHLGILGWTVIGSEAQLTRDLQHKYTGLPVEIGEAFILRDLTDSGSVFAQLRVRRGVPHCSICGSVLYWQLARSWCLEPGRFPGALTETFTRLFPAEPLPKAEETVSWPLSGWKLSDSPRDPQLLECPHCGLLAPVGGAMSCQCGATRRLVRRTLLPVLVDALALWTAETPFVAGDDVRFYLPLRRSVPLALHLLLGMISVRVSSGEIRLLTSPTLPAEAPTGPSPLPPPADATRAALLLTRESPRDGDQELTARRGQEARRLRKVWQIAQEVVGQFLAAGFAPDARAVADRIGELAEEDRAFLSLFERMRSTVLKAYEAGEVDVAHARLATFMDLELRDGYLALVAPRLAASGNTTSKTGVLRVLAHALPLWVELYAPIAPFTMEAIHRGLRGDSQSVFERPITPVQERLLNPELERSYAHWRTIVGVLDSYRRELGSAPGTVFESAVLVVREENLAVPLRASAAVVARLAHLGTLEVASAAHAWAGRELTVRPIESEIQRAYPMQARRIVRILEGMVARRVQEAVATQSLEIVIEGARLPIAPAMIEVTESLPIGVVPVPCPIGELYVRLEPTSPSGQTPGTPPLTPDAYRLLRAVERRIARASIPSAIDVVHVSARGAFSDELARQVGPLSQHLGGVEVVLHPDSSGFTRIETSRGRAGRGDPWALWIPGAPLRVTVKERPAPRAPSRVRARPMAAEGMVSIDYLDDGLRARETDIREAVEQFDRDLGRPLLGPAKLAAAWQLGFDSHEAVAHAPFEALSTVPGFGPAVAGAVVRHYGGDVPATAVRLRRVASVPPTVSIPRESEPDPEAVPQPVVIAEPAAAADLVAPAEPVAVTDPVADAEPLAPVEREIGPPADLNEAPSPVEPLLPTDLAPTRTVEVAPSFDIPAPVEDTETVAPIATLDNPLEPAPRPAAPAADDTTGPMVPPHLSTEPLASEASPPVPAPAPPPPSDLGIETWAEATSERAFAAFLDGLRPGTHGLCLSREFPERLRRSIGPRDVQVVWLSNVGREGAVRPADIEGLQALFRQFLERPGPGLAFIEGVEYLVRIHGLEKTVEMLRGFDEGARSQGVRVWLPLNPALLDPAAHDQIVHAFRTVA